MKMLNVMHGNILVPFQDIYTELNQRLQKSLNKLLIIYSDVFHQTLSQQFATVRIVLLLSH